MFSRARDQLNNVAGGRRQIAQGSSLDQRGVVGREGERKRPGRVEWRGGQNPISEADTKLSPGEIRLTMGVLRRCRGVSQLASREEDGDTEPMGGAETKVANLGFWIGGRTDGQWENDSEKGLAT